MEEVRSETGSSPPERVATEEDREDLSEASKTPVKTSPEVETASPHEEQKDISKFESIEVTLKKCTTYRLY